MNNTSAEYLEACRAALESEQTRSLADTAQWSHVDKPQVHRDWDALYRRMAPLVGHLPAGDAAVQALVAEHFGIVSRFYVPSKQAYIGMGLFYGENADMLNFHSSYHPGMVPFLAEAMAIHAERCL